MHDLPYETVSQHHEAKEENQRGPLAVQRIARVAENNRADKNRGLGHHRIYSKLKSGLASLNNGRILGSQIRLRVPVHQPQKENSGPKPERITVRRQKKGHRYAPYADAPSQQFQARIIFHQPAADPCGGETYDLDEQKSDPDLEF